MLHRGVLQGVTLSSVLRGVTLSINTLVTLIISGHTRNTPHGITCGLRAVTVVIFCNFVVLDFTRGPLRHIHVITNDPIEYSWV